MSAHFEVGAAVIGVGFVGAIKLNGAEGVIAEYWGDIETLGVTTQRICKGHTYLVAWASGRKDVVKHHNLRRKQPPKREIDTVVSWQDCAWKPSKAAA